MARRSNAAMRDASASWRREGIRSQTPGQASGPSCQDACAAPAASARAATFAPWHIACSPAPRATGERCWVVLAGGRGGGVTGTARGEDPLPGDASGGRGEPPPPLAAPELTRVNGAPFVWPALDAALYAGAGPFREAVAAWREQGARPARSLPPANSPAALYLAADFAYPAAAAGAGHYLAA